MSRSTCGHGREDPLACLLCTKEQWSAAEIRAQKWRAIAELLIVAVLSVGAWWVGHH
jgi:hypothetical protein